jgi:hypothetical protein
MLPQKVRYSSLTPAAQIRSDSHLAVRAEQEHGEIALRLLRGDTGD